MTLTAPVSWAQRKDQLFLTIDLPDVDEKTASIKLTDEKLTFTGKSQGQDYSLDLQFLKENEGIDSSAEGSKYNIRPRNIQFLLVKKKEGFWPRLLEDKQLQKTNVRVDFSRYVDSDDEDEGGFDGAGMSDIAGGMGGMGDMGGMGGMNMQDLQSMMQGMGGGDMGGLAGEDEGSDDEDEEEIPDLN